MAEMKEVSTMDMASESKSNDEPDHLKMQIEVEVEHWENDVYQDNDEILEEVKTEPGCDSDDEMIMIIDEGMKDIDKIVSKPKDIEIMENLFQSDSIKDTNSDSNHISLEKSAMFTKKTYVKSVDVDKRYINIRDFGNDDKHTDKNLMHIQSTNLVKNSINSLNNITSIKKGTNAFESVSKNIESKGYEVSYKCSICFVDFSSSVDFNRHIESKHTVERHQIETVINHRNKLVIILIRSAVGTPLTCTYCKVSFKNLISLVTHMDNTPMKCCNCFKLFLGCERIQKHISRCLRYYKPHIVRSNLKIPLQKEAVLEKIDNLIQRNNEIRRGECYACKTIFPTDSFLSAHIKAMLKSDERCEKCNMLFTMTCQKTIHRCLNLNSSFKGKKTLLNEISHGNNHRQKHSAGSSWVQVHTSLVDVNPRNTVDSKKFKIAKVDKTSVLESISSAGKITNTNNSLLKNDLQIFKIAKVDKTSDLESISSAGKITNTNNSLLRNDSQKFKIAKVDKTSDLESISSAGKITNTNNSLLRNDSQKFKIAKVDKTSDLEFISSAGKITNTNNSLLRNDSQKFKIAKVDKTSVLESISSSGKITNFNNSLPTNYSRAEKSYARENYIDVNIKVGTEELRTMNVFQSSTVYRPIKVENQLTSLIKTEEYMKQDKSSIESMSIASSSRTLFPSLKAVCKNEDMDIEIINKPIEWINVDSDDDNLVIDEPVLSASEDGSNVPKLDSWSHCFQKMVNKTKAKSRSTSEGKKMLKCLKCNFHSTRKLYKNHYNNCPAVKKMLKKRVVDCNRLSKETRYFFSYLTPCLLCSESFDSVKKYYLHFTCHGYDGNQCPYCLKTIDKREFLKHCTTHVRTNYHKHIALEGYQAIASKRSMRCVHCGKEVKHVDYLAHYESHAMMYNPENECGSLEEVAEAQPEEEEGIPSHMFRMAIDKLTDVKNYDRTPGGGKTCMICPKNFDRNTDLKRHLIEHLYLDTSLHREANCGYKCQICKQICQNPRKYKYHLRQHATLSVYKCELCDMTFCDSSNFAKHKKVHDINCMQCPMCKRKFETNKMFQQHLERHRNSVKIECEICSKIFFFRSEYTKHYRNRHQKQMFNCSYCRIKFSTLKNLWDHQWEDHQFRKSKADCDECGASFRKKHSLKAHIRGVHMGINVTSYASRTQEYAMAADQDSDVNVET